jgi:hypothetical protein
MSDGYTKVTYCCVNAPEPTRKGAGKHTFGYFSFGNAAGARWGSAMRPQTCPECGGAIIARASHFKEAWQYEHDKQLPLDK